MVHDLPKAMLFDMDDTILTYSLKVDESWLMVYEHFLDAFSGVQSQDVLQAIKASANDYWSDPERHRVGRLDLDKTRQRIVTTALRQLGIEHPSLGQDMALLYADYRDQAIQPFPGALATLQKLREHGVRLALLTNGNAVIQRRRVEKHALPTYFDYILIEGEFGVGKPDHRVYFHALEQLGVTPQEAWMVGDNLEWEVSVPQSLGIFAIWYDFAQKGLPASSEVTPDRIITSLSELVNELD